jgi:Protein of unknown function (DUF433)
LRYPVEMLLELLSAGMSIDEVLADYPDLERDDLRAALEFGAVVAGGGRVIPLTAARNFWSMHGGRYDWLVSSARQGMTSCTSDLPDGIRTPDRQIADSPTARAAWWSPRTAISGTTVC